MRITSACDRFERAARRADARSWRAAGLRLGDRGSSEEPEGGSMGKIPFVRGPARVILPSLFAITLAVAMFARPVIAGPNTNPNSKSSSRELTEDAKGEFE